MERRLPENFIKRMKTQLPETEWEAFFSVYGEKPQKGLRVNLLKCCARAFKEFSPYALEQVPWEENGFYISEEKVGGNAYHFAGVFYSQEPSAMCAAPLLGVKAGEKVLDLCAAPGGKSTQLAAKMQGEGIIVMNEPVYSRAKILLENAERVGVTNAVITCELPQTLEKRFAGYFDKILVDAPCSGEGMFRKNAEEALGEWSEENVALCAARQKEILNAATKMLKKGGRLVYSTCTFSVEEDEGQVQDYLNAHPEMSLLRTEKLYPHKVRGEGHFAALFEKVYGEEEPSKTVLAVPKCSPAAEKLFREFEKQTLQGEKVGGLYEKDGVLYSLPSGVFEWKGLNVLRVGLRLGELKNGRFEPDHALALSLKAERAKRAVRFAEKDERLEKFLRGESVEADVENGWCLVCVREYPVGWGKAVNGVVKNHIPKRLRKNG
ncbi:MAG: RsmF rRNA methyltransferase first C-terminal domain-containing protein [Clostridia bacterium]|nr:RsmF rRNA methyltransferase first C-terminal domain-containing protein [Clostridia bacterium]